MTSNSRQESLVPTSKVRSERVKNWVQIITILLAGIWAGSTWLYLYVYLPYTAPAHVSMRIDTNKRNERDELISVTATVTIANTGDRPIYSLDSAYMVYGIDIEKNDKYKTPESFMHYVMEEMNGPKNYQRMFHKDVAIHHDDVLGAGRIIQRGRKLEPNQEYHNVFIIYAPKEMDYLRIIGYLYPADELDKNKRASWTIEGLTKLFFKDDDKHLNGTIEEVIVDLW